MLNTKYDWFTIVFLCYFFGMRNPVSYLESTRVKRSKSTFGETEKNGFKDCKHFYTFSEKAT